MNIEIQPLSKHLLKDYLFFFDTMNYNENPEWSVCYCYSYHFTGDESTCTRESNHSAVINLIKQNKLRGYLVFHNNKPIGWCNANNRLNYQRLLKDFDLIDNPADKVCSIVCFLIHPDYRRQGIAQKILDRIIADYSITDYDYIETYPKKGKLSNIGSFRGPLELYQKNDFVLQQERDTYYIMKRKLK